MVNKVNHPNFDSVLERGCGTKNLIVCFRVGRYVQPPVEAQQAQQRVMAVLESLNKEDMALVRQWSGRIRMEGISGYIDNTETTPEMKIEFVEAAKAAYPDYDVVNEWENRMHGIDGYSVEIAPKRK